MRPGICEDCKFWDNSTQQRDAQPDTTGLCRINPPIVSKHTGEGIWPFTSDTDWCAKFEERPPTLPQCSADSLCSLPDGHAGAHNDDNVPF